MAKDFADIPADSTYHPTGETAESKSESATHSTTNIDTFVEDSKSQGEIIHPQNYSQVLLRDRNTLFDDIYHQRNLNDIIRYFFLMALGLLATYGICLGTYSGPLQMISSAIKIPTLFFLTLMICAPALYTFNVLLGSKLTFMQIIAMLVIKTFLISLVLASFAPILLFFVVTAGSHDFTTLLNVSMCGTAGVFGLSLLWKGMEYITSKRDELPNNWILTIWIFIYMFVGTQLAWTLRPFVGAQGQFALFREVEGNFYIYLFNLLAGMVSDYPLILH